MKRVLLSFRDFKNSAHNMNRLIRRSLRPETKLGRTNFVIEVMSKTL